LINVADAAEIVQVLSRGGLVVMRSDTVYGIFAAALNELAVGKLRVVRERSEEEGFIVLADSVDTVARLVELSDELRKRLTTIWRADSSTSVILPADGLEVGWLSDRRESKPTICFRVPHDEKLRQLLAETGPLCAPSANLPGQPPARNITEAEKYFGDRVDLYVDGGECDNATPSRIIKFRADGSVETVRADGRPHSEDFVITRRRKLYKFAQFNEYPTCFHFDEWLTSLARPGLARKDVVVEIGAGSALFAVELARRCPEKTFLAVDIKGDRLYQGAREAAKLGLDNIYFIRSDIARIAEIVPAHSTSEIWLTFPDPWPPKSDARHRLTAPRYLNYYREILARPGLAKNNGILHFKTDNSPLFEWSLEQFAAGGWQTEFLTRDLHDSDASAEAKIMTSYEQRFVAEGLKINYVRFALTN
jgi:tRNA (guanine-N7-)-methyltransferase